MTFTEGGKEYCYLSDEDYEPGEFVIVPAGPDNRPKVVRIESVEYHPTNEAPYPLDRIKRIIRRFNKETDMDLLNQDR